MSKCFTIGLSINQSVKMLESENYKFICMLAEMPKLWVSNINANVLTGVTFVKCFTIGVSISGGLLGLHVMTIEGGLTTQQQQNNCAHIAKECRNFVKMNLLCSKHCKTCHTHGIDHVFPKANGVVQCHTICVAFYCHLWWTNHHS